MPDPSLAQAILFSTITLGVVFLLARIGSALAAACPPIMNFARYLVDRKWPKDPETITAEAIAKAAIEPIEVGRLIGVCNEAITKHDELIELNRKDLDVLLKRAGMKDAMLQKMNAPTLKPRVRS